MKNKKTPILILLISLSACAVLREQKVVTPQDVTTSWALLTLDITKNTPSNSPTYASRALGYIGLTMYESVVHGDPAYNSLAGELNGLGELPLPQAGKTYDWLITMNAGQAFILKKMYHQTSDQNKIRIDSLENHFLEYFSETINDQEIVNRSVEYGKAIAEKISSWAETDGGHRGYLNNFDKAFIKQSFPGSWEPPLYGQSFSHYPLHPHWGENRMFLLANQTLPVPLLLKYDTSRISAYYHEYIQVYEKSKVLSMPEKEAALWWGDDPGETFTPPGHSWYLATLVIKKVNPGLTECASTYARVGLAVADAFINCWKSKYHYYSERPSSFISKNIDTRWESFWPDPPFPSFPSGHATQGAAVATVLADLYGQNIEITDDAHTGRPKDELRGVEFKPRSFSSFWQIAEEIANSRFYGGIHSQQDNLVGLAEGIKIGKNVNALNWRREKNYAGTIE